jgi:lambda family phage portal protein
MGVRAWLSKIANRNGPARAGTGRRSYAGAANVARYADFTASERSADAELYVSLVTLRARSRNLARNNPHIRRYIQLMQDNIVGANGFQLQVKATNESNGGPDTAGNRRVEDAWRRWSRTATADGMMTMREATNLAVRTWARDGEVIVQKVRGRKYRDGMALYFIEADRLDITLNSRASNGNRIKMGVEIDDVERPVAYHFLTYHPGDTDWTSIPSQKKHQRIPASDIVHHYIKSRPGQTRGEPPMCGIMTDAKMLAGYREAEITNRRIAAAKGGFFARLAGAGDVKGIADAQDPDTGTLEMEAEPGKFSVLPEGYEFRAFDPAGSSTDYADFEKQIIKSMAAGLGTSYVDLAMDLEGVSFSSARHGALTDRDFYRGMQRFFIEQFVMPIYSDWLSSALDFGDVGLPAFRFDKFNDASYFRGRGWSWVDPLKDVNASIKAHENNMVSLTHIAGEQGRELEDVIDEIVAERKMMESKGVSLAPPDGGAVAKGPPKG